MIAATGKAKRFLLLFAHRQDFVDRQPIGFQASEAQNQIHSVAGIHSSQLLPIQDGQFPQTIIPRYLHTDMRPKRGLHVSTKFVSCKNRRAE